MAEEASEEMKTLMEDLQQLIDLTEGEKSGVGRLAGVNMQERPHNSDGYVLAIRTKILFTRS